MKSRFLLALFLFITQTALAGYSLDATFALPPPPSARSSTEQSDYAELHRWQEIRTSKECKTANSQTYMSLESFFGPQTGILTDSQLDAVAGLLTEVKKTVAAEGKILKDRFARKRPYAVDRTIKPCIQMPSGISSYPSTHAAMGITLSRVLADLLPENGSEIEAQGIQIGTNRVLGGVHHPSDITAGQELGDEIYEALQSNAQFKADFREAKRALR